jgi:phosphate transport system substrate-binding protein
MGLISFLGWPVMADLSLFLGLLVGGFSEVLALAAVFLPLPVVSVLVWVFFARRADTPERMSRRFLPVFASFGYYMTVWMLAFGLASYHSDDAVLSVFFPLSAPYLFVNILLAFGGDLELFPIIQAAILLTNFAAHQAMCAVGGRRRRIDGGMFLYGTAALLLCLAAGYLYFDRAARTLPYDHAAERVGEDVPLGEYRPFSEDSLLEKLAGAPGIVIDGGYPKIDGATAAYPVYAAVAQALYSGLDSDSAGEYVQCTRTKEAYDRLISGHIDVFFGAEPSVGQVEAARERGVELELIPIAREAFVLFVNRDNPVGNLTTEQARDIYRKRVTNWSDLGGRDEKIIPFQRPEGSGSQTIMQARVMNGHELAPPLREEYVRDMGGVVREVASYRNYSSAIGYSFRYFVTRMTSDEGVKLLSIDGAEPSIQNIRDGTYPFTIEVYAVMAGSQNVNARRLIDWILSEQGQDFIEQCGYVRR